MYRSKFETGISVSVFFNFVHRYFGMGRYAMGHQMLLNSSTIFRGKKLLKNTFNENVRLLKRLHTIGLAMFVWSPNPKKSQMKHWLHRVCVSWGVHTQAASRCRYILQCSCRMKLVGRAQGMRAMSFLESVWAILRIRILLFWFHTVSFSKCLITLEERGVLRPASANVAVHV